MAASDLLDDLRLRFPSCELIAFIDLSSDMVLAKSAGSAMLQERWDLLCAMAREGMTPAGHDTSYDRTAQNDLLVAALMNEDECDIFLRSAALSDYVICAVGQPNLPVSQFYKAAIPVLDALVQDD